MQTDLGWRRLVILMGALGLGCGSASTGASENAPAPPPDNDAASSTADGSSCGPSTDGGPSSWASLYHDYFGATGAASCSSAACHGADTGMGYVSTHFLCPACEPATCYGSITSPSTLPVFLETSEPFEQTNLYTFLRHVAPGGGTVGIMPMDSLFTFQESDIQRISNWVAAGAKDD